MLTVFVRSFLVVGRNDGSVRGVRYFTCEDKHGLFVRPHTCTYHGVNCSGLKWDKSNWLHVTHLKNTTEPWLQNWTCFILTLLMHSTNHAPCTDTRIPISSSTNLVSFCTICSNCWTREQQLEIIHDQQVTEFITCHALKLPALAVTPPFAVFCRGMYSGISRCYRKR